MSHPPSTPVKIPGAAATYTDATIDAQLRSDINSLLLKDGHIAKIQDTFLHALNAHSANWPSAVQTHALSLLRSGEVSTFPALIRRVLDDVRQDTQTRPHSNDGDEINAAAAGTGTGKKAKNGEVNGVNGKSKAVNGANGSGGAGGGETSLAIPTGVVEDVLRVTRESLEALCAEVEDED